MPGEAPGGDRGHVTPLPGTNAGPVIDRLWSRAPRAGGGLVPSRPAPTGYRQWPTRRLGAMLGAVPGWFPFAALAAIWAGAVMYGAYRGRRVKLRGDDDSHLPFHQRMRRARARGGVQTWSEGKWTPFRAGETVTTMFVETPDGMWQAKVTKDGTWSVRGPDRDNETHYGYGEVTADTDRELVTLAKKQARAFLKARLG